MKRLRAPAFFCFLFTSFLCFNAAFAQSKEIQKDVQPDISEKDFSQLFENIVTIVRKEYVEKTTNRELLEAALQGMMTSLDPHSDFLTEKEFEDIKDTSKGNYGGLGVEILPIDLGIRVISPMEDSPAQKAGLKAGDLIIAVEGEPISRTNIIKAVQNIRGTPGTSVLLTIKRGDNVFDVSVKRAIIEVSPVKWEAKGDVGYIRISLFNEKTPGEIKKAVKELTKKIGSEHLKGFVIDVRNNAGGLLEEGVQTTESFLPPHKKIVSIKGRDGKLLKEYTSKAHDITGGAPLVVMINGGSASAAEIFAGALKDQNRAVLVGSRSFGKGSVQSVQEIKNLGALKMTIALFYTPSDRIIQKEGIEPNISVEQVTDLKTINSNKRLREAYFKDSIRGKQDTEEEEKTFKESIKDLKDEPNFKDLDDYQLDQALNILRALNLARIDATQQKTPTA